MKKKIGLSIIFVSIFLIIISKQVSAKTYEDDYISCEIPNSYTEKGYHYGSAATDMVFEDSKNDATYICLGHSIRRGEGPYTQEYVNKQVENEKKRLMTDEFAQENWNIIQVTGKLIEINGAKGYKMTSLIEEKKNGKYFIDDRYYLLSDNRFYFMQITGYKSSAFLNQLRDVIDSIKIKDTVMWARGIPYTDVSEKAWYYDAVKYTYDYYMISGYNAYTFAPNDKLTRGMLVTILWRMEGEPKTNLNKFPDVKSKDWYYQAVNWAASKGIVSGYKTGKFGPRDNITREQLAAILMNYAKYKGKNTSSRANTSKFKDFNKTSSVFKDAVSWCIANKIISGKENGTKIDPKGTASRAEAASMLMSYCLNVK